MDKIRKYCPNIEWLRDYAIMGPWDYIDIFMALSAEAALEQVASLAAEWFEKHMGKSHEHEVAV